MKLDIPDIRNIKLVRRDFLKLSSASVVAPALAGSVVTLKPFPAIGFAEAVTAAQSPRVSIGYWDGRLASPFVDARQVEAADDRLADGVTVRVVGCCGDDGISTWAGFRSVSMGFSLLPFHDGDLRVWQYQTSPVINTSSLAAFNLPIDKAVGVVGWIEYRDHEARSTSARVPFRLGFEETDRAAKLRSGHYVIVMREPGTLRSMDWQALRLRVTDGGNALSLRHDDGRNVDLPHIVVEIRSI